MPYRIFIYLAVVGVSVLLFGSVQAQETTPDAPPPPVEGVDTEPPSVPAKFVPKDLKPVIGKIELFFQTLGTEGSQAAYPLITEGSLLATKKDEVEKIITMTDEAFKAFGNIEACELIDMRRTGSRLVSVTYLGACPEMPIQWNFLYYWGGGRWRLLDIDVTNDFRQMIDHGADVR